MSYNIAIVGLGPKGLFAFERLLYEINRSTTVMDISVYLFEKSGFFGCGSTYSLDQPDFLLMNYPNRNIDVWGIGNHKNQEGRKSLTEFLSASGSPGNPGDGLSPRKIVGKYLASCYESLCASCNVSTTIVPVIAVVEAIYESHGHFAIEFSKGNGREVLDGIDQVLITSGHDSWKGQLEGNRVSIVDRMSDIPFIYPLAENFRGIPSSSIVAVKGLGLTYIDAVLGLTEGRDGTFSQTGNSVMHYEPSGLEPKKILPFSKSGLPMVPRSGIEGKTSYTPKYFTYDNIHANITIGNRPDFNLDILPLLIKETEYRYYKVLIKQMMNLDLDDVSNGDFESTVDEFHRNGLKIPAFDFENLFRPVTMERPNMELSPVVYYRYILSEAEKGSASSPFMAAVLTWGKVSELFNGFYSFGGLTPEAQHEFDRSYRSRLNRIAYGPPLENARKILALMENGILDMSIAVGPEVLRLAKGWSISYSTGNEVRADYLVDARIPGNKSRSNWSALLTNMAKEGLIREFINPGKESYKTACPEIDRSGRAIAFDGSINEMLTFYGTPTEGITYDNDTLSRKRNDFASAWALRCVERAKKNYL